VGTAALPPALREAGDGWLCDRFRFERLAVIRISSAVIGTGIYVADNLLASALIDGALFVSRIRSAEEQGNIADMGYAVTAEK
jgi:hypothetical protein